MDRSDNSQSGQTLVEYALLVALVSIVVIFTLGIPSILIYLYLRHARHVDRQTALLVAFGVLLVMNLIGNLTRAFGRHSEHCDCSCEDCHCQNGCCDCCGGKDSEIDDDEAQTKA